MKVKVNVKPEKVSKISRITSVQGNYIKKMAISPANDFRSVAMSSLKMMKNFDQIKDSFGAQLSNDSVSNIMSQVVLYADNEKLQIILTKLWDLGKYILANEFVRSLDNEKKRNIP